MAEIVLLETVLLETVFSSFVETLFDTLSSTISEELKLQYGVREELRKLEATFSTIQAVLKDAEEKQFHQSAVKQWLTELRDVAYDINDVLDEFATEAERQQLIAFPQVRNLLSPLNPKRGIFRHRLARSIQEITERVDGIVKRRSSFGLRVGDYRPSPRGERGELPPPTTSLGDSSVFGRESDKQKIVQFLVSDDEVGEGNISVIPIVGMGGLGKTTFAQLIYNDEVVEKHFELRLWVHVSQDFNVNRLTKDIVESIESADKYVYDSINLDSLQHHLQKKLRGRKCLLVLDDVWNENLEKWERLRAPLLGAGGSKVLVTTSSGVVANLMGTSPPYNLQGLSDDDCWLLFCKYALEQIPYEPSEIDSIRKEIVKKCKGLPLAAKALGCLLRSETDRNKWATILRNNTWELHGESSDPIFQSLMLSYQHLPGHIKRCFAYCSIFPKSFEFEREVIVQLWRAQGFIRSRREQIEDIGNRYFNYLVQRSFFQYSDDSTINRQIYKMHDLIHDFAQHVSGEEFCRVESGEEWNISENARHLLVADGQFEQKRSYSSELGLKGFQKLYACKGLYTLLLVGVSSQVPDDLANKLSRLRSLDLSNSALNELPKSVGDLKHLRYLMLCNTNIRKLPASVGRLLNLENLGLRNCYLLEKLPTDTKKLSKLQHLDLHLDDGSMLMAPQGGSTQQKRDNLQYMPPEIGKLTDLKTLSRFVVSRESKSGLSELKELINLRGELCISNLHLVLNAAEAMEANLTTKQHLTSLQLRWGDGDDNSPKKNDDRVEEGVLKSLQPPTNLKELRISGYKGATFPIWIGYSSYSNLVTLKLCNCKNCEILPQLGRLPKLKDLHIEGTYGVTRVDCNTFCGNDAIAFPSLQRLQFVNMKSWEVWCGDEECILPSLAELVIKNCEKLLQLSHNLPALTKLNIEGCPGLLGLPRFPSLHSLDVKASGEWIWGSWPCLTSLSSLTLTGLPTTTLPQELQGGRNASMRRLEISYCNQLVFFPDDWIPTGLTYLGIKHCPLLRTLPSGLTELTELEDLEIHDCPQLSTLPDGLNNLTSLGRLEISDCSWLLSLPSDGLPKSLQFLSISNCSFLSDRCLNDRGRDWPKIANIYSVWIDKELVVSAQHRSSARASKS